MHDVAVVTVNYEMRDSILAMLHSLYRDVQGSGLDVQPIIVDNSSDSLLCDALSQQFNLAERPPIYMDAGANLGFATGNNLAVRRVNARYYFIANPDLELRRDVPGTVARLHAFMEERIDVGIVAPRLERPDGTTQPSCMRFPALLDQPLHRLGWHYRFRWARERVMRLHMEDVDHGTTRPIDWAVAAALFVRGEAMRAVGGFDERYFMYIEDCDVCRTFWSRGWPVYYKGDVVIQHAHQRSSAKISGMKSLVMNPLTRVHLMSLLKYRWKWRGQRI
jgi:N-acetylglucosaminyl-diphospho-decaprenol L-rhamnosyltransferase